MYYYIYLKKKRPPGHEGTKKNFFLSIISGVPRCLRVLVAKIKQEALCN